MGPGGPRGGGRGRGGPAEWRRNEGPSLSLSLSVQNVLNHVNAGTPVGNLSSPAFGRSLSSAGAFGRGPGAGPGGGGGNRSVELQLRASF